MLSLSLCTAAWAQTEEVPKPAAEAASEASPLVITNKEVAAVQAELQRRGYYRNTPNGILHAETRGANNSNKKENQKDGRNGDD